MKTVVLVCVCVCVCVCVYVYESWYFEYQRNCELTVSLVIMKQDIH